MWGWLLVGYAVFVAALAGYAAHVALSGADRDRRADAYKVLKLVWGTGTGAGGLFAAVLQLQQVGLLP